MRARGPGSLLISPFPLTLLWIGALCLTGIAYSAGMRSPFLFDDYPNLGALTLLNVSWAGIYELTRYSLGGVSSVLGRPLSLISFALQKNSWPGNPEDFLYVNICLHLLNAALIALCLRRMLVLARLPEPVALRIALLTSLLWAAAPIQASAVLYAVQRMAILSAIFCFTGLLIYLAGRQRLQEGKTGSGIAAMAIGVGFGTGVGVLAKENAALLPLLILVLEHTLLPPPEQRQAWRWAQGVLLVAPVVVLIGYLAYRFPTYTSRDFTVGERLMTEGRILFTYLRDIALPTSYGMRLFYDDVAISRSLMAPLSTLLAVLAWAVLLAVGIMRRRTWPFLAFAILWFLAAHAMESTVLPLEIAFGHRNYVAALGPLLLLVVLSWKILASSDYRKVVKIAAAGALLLYSGYTLAACWQSARLRGAALYQAGYWYQRQPASMRAHVNYALELAKHGLGKQAGDILGQAHTRWPDDPSVLTLWFELSCEVPALPSPTVAEIEPVIARSPPQFLNTANSLSGTVDLIRNGKCARHSAAEVEQLVDAAIASPHSRPYRQQLFLASAYAAEAGGNRKVAIGKLEKAINTSPAVVLIRQRVYWAVEAGDTETARRYLRIADQDPRISAAERWAHRRDIKGMNQLVAIVEEYKAHYGSMSVKTK